MPDNTLSTLAQIRTKVRRLTRSPSVAQLTDQNIDDYVNNFLLYDFPEHVRLESLRTTLTFYTAPNIDTYSTNTANPNDPLFNFKNRYVNIYSPVYIAGYPAFYSQSRSQFYGIYPIVNQIFQVGTGDGVTLAFAGTLNSIPVLQNNVVIASVDVNNNPLSVKDVPTGAATGNLVVTDTAAVVGAINYITGVFNVTFPTAPAQGQAINSETVPYVASQPHAVLYYNDEFIIRPVPDQPYAVNLEVQIRPSELLNGVDMPQLSQWWQYIAYGASKKVFEDRMDMDSVQMIMPEFKMQERLALRKTIAQLSQQRSATIYTEQTSTGTGGNGWGWGGGLF